MTFIYTFSCKDLTETSAPCLPQKTVITGLHRIFPFIRLCHRIRVNAIASASKQQHPPSLELDRMLLIQAVLLSCLSLRSSTAIYAFDSEAINFCHDDCFLEGSDSTPTPCDNSTDGHKTRRVCDMKGDPEEFRINANNAASWDVLSVTNASTVKLEATKLVHSIFLKRVARIVLDSSRTRSDGFSFLRLEDCKIGDEYTLSFGSLKELSIVSSVIGVIKQTSINKIDILNGSRIKKLSAGAEMSESTFHDSTLDKIKMLHITGNAKIVMRNMTIKDVQNLEYSSSSYSSVSSSYIEKITSMTSLPSTGKLEFYEVEIGEIISKGVTIMGQIQITNSVIRKSPINGIVISGSGEITFKNATINGVQLSYTMKADPSSITISVLHQFVVTFPYSIVYWVIIVVLAAVIVVLLYFVIKPAVAMRNSNAAGDPDSKNLKSNDPRNVSANIYSKNAESEDIPMATRDKPDSTKQAAMPQSDGAASPGMLTPPLLSTSQDSFDASILPPPPPQMLFNHADILQPLYDDIECSESNAQNSGWNSLNKISVGQKRKFPPSPNAQTSGQASHALHHEVPSLAARPMFPPHSIPNPVAPSTALPISSHYATRGHDRPPPPLRDPPAHRMVSQPTNGHGQPPVEFHPPPAANMPDYQDTIHEEPLYASEDELRNY